MTYNIILVLGVQLNYLIYVCTVDPWKHGIVRNPHITSDSPKTQSFLDIARELVLGLCLSVCLSFTLPPSFPHFLLSFPPFFLPLTSAWNHGYLFCTLGFHLRPVWATGCTFSIVSCNFSTYPIFVGFFLLLFGWSRSFCILSALVLQSTNFPCMLYILLRSTKISKTYCKQKEVIYVVKDKMWVYFLGFHPIPSPSPLPPI